MSHHIRPLDPLDLQPLTTLWHDGWREAHLEHVPEGLIRLRTRDSFTPRLLAFGDGLRVAGPVGAPVGMCATREDELDQLFVAPEARGTDLAQRLLADGEARLAKAGIRRAHLLCMVENARAVRFYTRQGWESVGVRCEPVQTAEGPFSFDVLRFEKDLPTAPPPK